jgi:hypothetical protein
MARTLTKKQKGFVKDYLETGVATTAVKMNYPDIKSELSARVQGSRLLTNDNVLKSIQEALPDDLLAERHLELLNKREIRYSQDGDELSNEPDTQAVTKGLDMAYKLKGSYAPEKSTALNVNVGLDKIENTELNALREEFEQKLRDKFLE